MLFIGANDDGSSAGTPITDELLLSLGAIRADGNILPLPHLTVQKRLIGDGEFAVVEVHPSSAPPVRYRGRVWVRIGPRRAVASADEERRLNERRRSFDLPFDHQPVSGSSIDDLDLSLFERTYLPAAVSADALAANERSLVDRLTSLRMLATDGAPTVAGLLTIGKDPRSWIPAAYMQFVRFDGHEVTDPILHQVEADGLLPDLVKELDNILKAQIAIRTTVEPSGSESRHADYPLAALSQIARNAVMHRSYKVTHAPIRIYWYSDRVHSPGGPFGQVTPENFGQPGVTDYRNPLLAEAMKTLGYVQRFGLGFPLARRELASNGNPDLQVDVQPSAVLVMLRRSP